MADSQPELKPPPLPAKRSKTPPSSAQTPPSELEAAGNWSAEDEALKKKVQELQKKKMELQKQREKAKVRVLVTVPASVCACFLGHPR